MRGEHGTDINRRSAASAAPALARPRGVLSSFALNVVALGGLWMVYTTVRTITANSWGAARANARWLIEFQDTVGLPSEAVVQSLFLDYEWFVRSANVYYMGVHFPAMGAFMIWVLLAKRAALPRVRLALIGATVAGLFIQLAFPLAPPRMLRFSGFVDTASLLGPDPYALGIAKTANELAAMPSMHVGWSLLVALGVIKLTNTRWRWLILAHPFITSFVVVVTANHYWADIVVGAGLAVLAWWIAGLVRPEPGADLVLGLVKFDEEAMAEEEPCSAALTNC